MAPNATEDEHELSQLIRSTLRPYPDFPTPGITFYDIFPLFHHPNILRQLVSHLVQHIAPLGPTAIVGMDARGFLFAPIIAMEFGIKFIPVRKAGKLPGECHSMVYEKEYGKDVFEIQRDVIQSGEKVVIVDDVLATGGTAQAVESLISVSGGQVVQSLFIMEIAVLEGRMKLKSPAHSILQI